MYQTMPTPITTPDFIATAPTAISTTAILSGLQWKSWMLPWGSILLVFDVLSFVLMSWMYIAGCDAVLGRICGGSRRRRSVREQDEAILRTLERWERQQWERWQREQWARMDAEIVDADSATEEGDRLEDAVVQIEFALSVEEREAWERHRVVQAEMRRFGVV